jgi:hypothetical protein
VLPDDVADAHELTSSTSEPPLAPAIPDILPSSTTLKDQDENPFLVNTMSFNTTTSSNPAPTDPLVLQLSWDLEPLQLDSQNISPQSQSVDLSPLHLPPASIAQGSNDSISHSLKKGKKKKGKSAKDIWPFM